MESGFYSRKESQAEYDLDQFTDNRTVTISQVCFLDFFLDVTGDDDSPLHMCFWSSSQVTMTVPYTGDDDSPFLFIYLFFYYCKGLLDFSYKTRVRKIKKMVHKKKNERSRKQKRIKLQRYKLWRLSPPLTKHSPSTAVNR